MRLTLLTLRRLRRRLLRQPNSHDTFQAVEQYLSVTANALAAVSESITRRVPAASGGQLLPQLEMLADSIRKEQTDERERFLAALQKDVRFQMDALTGQLRAAVRTTTETTAAAIQEFAIADARRPWQSRFFGKWAKVRANLTLRSSAFRHAVRLTLCLAIGEAVAHLLHHPRSYWLAMTIVIVLRQEFAATLQRGMLRILGTIIGLVFATVLFHAIPPGIGLEVFLIGVIVFVLRSAGAGNYGIFSIAMSALVVLLLAITGIPPMKLIFPRAEMTILGGLIALATYVLWPTWERSQAPEILAQLLEAYRHYFDALARPGWQEGRLARPNLVHYAWQLAWLVPTWKLLSKGFARSLARAPTRFPWLPLCWPIPPIYSRDNGAGGRLAGLGTPRTEFRTFTADVNRMLDELIRALRGDASRLRDLPDLREDHHRLVSSAASDISRYELVNQEADRMTNSLNTLAEQVAHWMRLR